MTNLIENSAKYSPDNATTKILVNVEMIMLLYLSKILELVLMKKIIVKFLQNLQE